jgi:hypothetical protein
MLAAAECPLMPGHASVSAASQKHTLETPEAAIRLSKVADAQQQSIRQCSYPYMLDAVPSRFLTDSSATRQKFSTALITPGHGQWLETGHMVYVAFLGPVDLATMHIIALQ